MNILYQRILAHSLFATIWLMWSFMVRPKVITKCHLSSQCLKGERSDKRHPARLQRIVLVPRHHDFGGGIRRAGYPWNHGLVRLRRRRIALPGKQKLLENDFWHCCTTVVTSFWQILRTFLPRLFDAGFFGGWEWRSVGVKWGDQGSVRLR